MIAEGRTSAPAGAFVGRQTQLAELAAVVGATRMVVLTGPPGVGKSRLASELTATIAGDHADGTGLVELAAVGHPAQVPVAVARALSVWEAPERPVIDSIVARLSSRRLLLVMDNCEHLLKGCAELAATLLGACPGLTILATSQETLGVSGERVWPVPPLSVPEAGDGPEQLARSDAVALFCARAEAVQPSFQATESQLEVVAEICRRLDGIPLAIELAAARVSMVTLRELADRLDHRFSVLTGTVPAATPRHQTLRMALEWSYGLLSPPGQAFLRALSVFPAGCTADAAAAVCARMTRRRARALLAGLVARSLVVAEAGPETRYRMLESIRLFAAERLVEAGESEVAQARQAEWSLALMEEAEPALTGRDQIRWLGLLDDEYANVSAALDRSQAQGEASIALRLTGALTVYWRIRGYFREGLERLTAALALDRGRTSTLRANALWGVGFMQLMLGDERECRRSTEDSLALVRELDDVRAQARCLLVLGNRAALVDDANSLELLEQSAALAGGAGDGWCLAHALGISGFVHLNRADLQRARQQLTRSLHVSRRNADQQSLRLALLLMGDLAVRNGELQIAEGLIREGLGVAQVLREQYAISVAQTSLGKLAALRGDYSLARTTLESALALARELGAATSIGHTVLALANLALDEGDLTAARDLYLEASTIGLHAQARVGLGELAVAAGDLVEARCLEEAALGEARRRDEGRCLADGTAALARVAVAEGGFTQAVSLHVEALRQRQRLVDRAGVIASLEDMALLAVALGAPERAARLFGIASARRQRGGYVRPPAQRPAYEAAVTAIRAALGPARFDDVIARGMAMPEAAAITYATRWTGTRISNRASTGRGALTMAERRVADLVAGGMTNAEVAAQLHISPLTVAAHLTTVFARLGVSSRRELRRRA